MICEATSKLVTNRTAVTRPRVDALEKIPPWVVPNSNTTGAERSRRGRSGRRALGRTACPGPGRLPRIMTTRRFTAPGAAWSRRRSGRTSRQGRAAPPGFRARSSLRQDREGQVVDDRLHRHALEHDSVDRVAVLRRAPPVDDGIVAHPEEARFTQEAAREHLREIEVERGDERRDPRAVRRLAAQRRAAQRGVKLSSAGPSAAVMRSRRARSDSTASSGA